MISFIFGHKLPNFNSRYIPIKYFNDIQDGTGTHFIGTFLDGAGKYCEMPTFNFDKINQEYKKWQKEQLFLLEELQKETVGMTKTNIEQNYRYVDKLINIIKNEKPTIFIALTK